MVERFLTFFSFHREYVAESFFEEVGTPQSGICFGDPLELLVLQLVEVFGVLLEGVAGAGDLTGIADGASSTAW